MRHLNLGHFRGPQVLAKRLHPPFFAEVARNQVFVLGSTGMGTAEIGQLAPLFFFTTGNLSNDQGAARP